MCLADGISSCTLVSRLQRSVVLDNYLVLSVSHIQVGPKMELVGEGLVETELNLITLGLNLTLVYPCRLCTIVAGHGTLATIYKDINTLVVEELDITGDETTENTVVDTDVGLLHLLPMDVSVTNDTFTIPCIRRLALVYVEIRGTIVSASHSPLCLIEETVADVVVTNLSIRGTNLEHVDNLIVAEPLHEWLIGDHPSYGS